MNWNIWKLLFYGSVEANSVVFNLLSISLFLEGDSLVCRKRPGCSFLKMFLGAFEECTRQGAGSPGWKTKPTQFFGQLRCGLRVRQTWVQVLTLYEL